MVSLCYCFIKVFPHSITFSTTKLHYILCNVRSQCLHLSHSISCAKQPQDQTSANTDTSVLCFLIFVVVSLEPSCPHHKPNYHTGVSFGTSFTALS